MALRDVHRNLMYVVDVVCTNTWSDLDWVQGGRIVVIGSRGKVEVEPIEVVIKESNVMGCNVFNTSAEEAAESAESIAKGAVEGWLCPIIGKKFSLAQANEAHEDIMGAGGAQGRTILTLD